MRNFENAVKLFNELREKMSIVMDVSVYQMRESVAGIEMEMRNLKADIAQNAANPAVTMEELDGKKSKVDALTRRRDMLMEQINEAEAKARENLQREKGAENRMTMEEARGRFYHAVLTGSNVGNLPQMVYEQLGAIPAGNADQGSGSNLIPKNLSKTLLLTPMVENPLRAIMRVTDIPGLEVSKLSFNVKDNKFLKKDGATAKEMEINSENITFGNFKMMLEGVVSQSILRSTVFDIESAVTSGLQGSQAMKEMSVIFDENPEATEAHMSFYSTKNAIKEVKGPTLLRAILKAYADLEPLYKPGATVVMREEDYLEMIWELANGNESFFSKPPKEVIGIPVVFCPLATKPVVGNFKYLQLNFNGAPLYDSDKDVSKGNMIFVLTHWYDVQILMKSAFRLAKVEAASSPGIGG